MSKMEAGCALMISSRPSMGLEVRRDFAKRANEVLIAGGEKRHVAVVSCCRVYAAHRRTADRTTNDKAAMSSAGGRRSALACVDLCACFDRGAKSTDLPPRTPG